MPSSQPAEKQERPPRKRWSLDRANKAAAFIALVVGSFWGVPKAINEWRLSGLQIQDMQSQVTSPNTSICIIDMNKPAADGTHLYDVRYELEVKNGSTAEVNVSYSFARVYVGTLAPLASTSPHLTAMMNSPEGPRFEDLHTAWQAVEPSDLVNRRKGEKVDGVDAILWKPIGYTASWEPAFAKNAEDSWARFVTRYWRRGYKDRESDVASLFAHQPNGPLMETDRSGGLTGVIAKGDTSSTEPEFVVRAHPEDFVGLVLAYGLDDEIHSPSPYINETVDMRRFLYTDNKTPEHCWDKY